MIDFICANEENYLDRQATKEALYLDYSELCEWTEANMVEPEMMEEIATCLQLEMLEELNNSKGELF